MGKTALAAIKNEKTLSELSEQFDVHQNQISEWKKLLLEQADTVFGSAQEHKAAPPGRNTPMPCAKSRWLASAHDPRWSGHHAILTSAGHLVVCPKTRGVEGRS